MGKAEGKKTKKAEVKDISNGEINGKHSIKPLSSEDIETKSKSASYSSFGRFSLFIILIGASALVVAAVMEAMRLDTDNKSLTKELNAANQKLGEKVEELKAILRKEKDVSEQLQISEGKNNKIDAQIAELKKDKENFEKSILAKDESIAKLQGETIKLEDELLQSVNKISKLEESLSQSGDQISKLELDISISSETIHDKEATVNSLESKLSSASLQLSDASDELGRLNLGMATKEEELTKLMEESNKILDLLEKEKVSKKDISDSLSDQIIKLENEVNLRQSENEGLSSEISLLSAEKAECLGEVNNMEKSIKVLETGLKNCTAAAELKNLENLKTVKEIETLLGSL